MAYTIHDTHKKQGGLKPGKRKTEAAPCWNRFIWFLIPLFTSDIKNLGWGEPQELLFKILINNQALIIMAHVSQLRKHNGNNFIVLLLFLFIAILPQLADARYACKLRDDYTVFYNATDNKFYTKEDVSSAISGDGDFDLPENITQVEAKRCSCRNSDYYCTTFHGENTCSAPQFHFDRPVTYCYKLEKFESLVGFFWMPSVLFLVIVCFLPCTSLVGKNAVLYVISPCFPCSNKKTVDRIIQQEMESITEHINIELSALSERDDGMVEQKVLKLKTRPINKDHQFLFEDKNCLICMTNLEEGERIGDISCGHSFHVDCLKEWVKRRNACPLCNTEVAESQIVLVSKEEAFSDDTGSVDEATRNQFEQLRDLYRRRSLRRIRGGP